VKPPWIATSKPFLSKACMGAGFVAASLLGSLGGQPASAFQATFNMQVADEAGTSRTFTSGGNSDLYTEMTVGSLSNITGGSSLDVTTNATNGLCVIGTACTGSPQAATFSFSKPIQNFRFTVGLNVAPSGLNAAPSAGGWGSSVLRFFVGTSVTEISLAGLAGTQSFPQSFLVAAGNSITVGFACSGDCPTLGNEQFFISDVIVEAPAPLPLIGTGAAFAWTRRLRRRIKATPSPISKG